MSPNSWLFCAYRITRLCFQTIIVVIVIVVIVVIVVIIVVIVIIIMIIVIMFIARTFPPHVWGSIRGNWSTGFLDYILPAVSGDFRGFL